jgi:hypothetical protein
MKRNIIISIILVLFIAACNKDVYEKPKKLIKEKIMIDMMVDIHLAEATYFNQAYNDTAVKKFTSSDFYYSVLHKYNVSDSLFESSFVYYASHPKIFEKMYRQVTNHLTEIEDENTNKQDDLLEFEDSEQ